MARLARAFVLAAVTGAASARAGAPATSEWVWHKTEDGLHPDGEEQQMVWLMNRARANPTQEGIWLAGPNVTQDPPLHWIEVGLTQFNVDRTLLRNEFAEISPRMPCAFDRRLYLAAKQHAEHIINNNPADIHDKQLQFIDGSGFIEYAAFRGVSAYDTAKSGIHAHGAFNIDWVHNPPSGMLANRGHRHNLMGSWPGQDYAFTNCGIAMVPKGGGNFTCSANYLWALEASENHANLFIVGTVYDDKNSNDRYDPGEGLEGVTVRPGTGSWHAVTGKAGGYAVPARFGSYDVTFSGGALPFEAVTVPIAVTVGGVLRDIEINRDRPIAIREPRVVRTGPGAVRLRWNAEAGLIYDVEESDDLRTWSVRTPDIGGIDGELTHDYSLGGAGGKYLRISARRP